MEDKTKTQSLVLMNKEVMKELADPAIVRALLATTFKKFDETLMKQAVFEGIIRGFQFKNFLQKDVYAIKYGDGYNLVTSIDLARKIAARGGVNGKSKPTYVDKDGKPVTCEITVYKKGGHPNGYTAEVYFDEYYKEGSTYNGTYKPSMWDTKPRTMIAKVAEMHALRMAAPDEMAKIYTAEEFDKESGEAYDTEGIDDDTIPTVHIGSSENEVAPNMTIDKKPRQDDFEMPATEVEQKNLIKALVMKKWPNLDIKDAKAFKTQIADYTELEYTVSNYPSIINALR